jgi:hypothetical protein
VPATVFRSLHSLSTGSRRGSICCEVHIPALDLRDPCATRAAIDVRESAPDLHTIG